MGPENYCYGGPDTGVFLPRFDVSWNLNSVLAYETHVFFFRSFHLCMHSTCVENFQTHTHTHRAAAMIDCLTWKDYWNTTETDDVNKAPDSCQFPGHKPLFGCGSKDVKGLETFVLLCFFCAPVGFRKNGVQFVHRSESYCVSSCICWRHQELFVLIPAQALR